MNLNIMQDAREVGDWLLSNLQAGSANAQPLASTLPEAKQRIEAAADEIAEDIASEAIGKLPGGGAALAIGGPLLDAVIVKLIAKGLNLFPGWTPAPAAAAPPARPAKPA